MSSTAVELSPTWNVSRIDRVASVRARIGWKALTAAEYQETGFTFLATPNIKSENIDFENVNYISQYRYDESPELKLTQGDVLLAKDGNTLGITNIVRELPHPATVNGSIAVIRPFDIDSRFLRYALASHYVQSHIAALRAGMGVPHLFQWDIKRLPIPRPSLRTQQLVADFLDAETARIDALITKKRRVLNLRRARFWAKVDEIAAGIKRVPLRRVLLSVVDGPFGSAFSSADYTDEGPAVVRLGNIGFCEYHHRGQARIHLDLYGKFLQHKVRPGDLLIAGLGDASNHAGRACVAPSNLGFAIVKGKCFCGRVDLTRASPHYLAYVLSSPAGARSIGETARGSTRSMINLEIVKSTLIPLPTVEVQHQIVERLTADRSHTNKTAALLEKQIELLQEHRQALITAAVTGEMEVPGVAR